MLIAHDQLRGDEAVCPQANPRLGDGNKIHGSHAGRVSHGGDPELIGSPTVCMCSTILLASSASTFGTRKVQNNVGGRSVLSSKNAYDLYTARSTSLSMTRSSSGIPRGHITKAINSQSYLNSTEGQTPLLQACGLPSCFSSNC